MAVSRRRKSASRLELGVVSILAEDDYDTLQEE
jgi:hypothetical protein